MVKLKKLREALVVDRKKIDPDRQKESLTEIVKEALTDLDFTFPEKIQTVEKQKRKKSVLKVKRRKLNKR